MQKIEITVQIENTTIGGDLLEIVRVLATSFKVTTPVIFQFTGEIGAFAINPNQIGFTRPYHEQDGLQVFTARVKKIEE